MQQGRPSKAVVIVRQSGGTCTEDRTAVSAGDALTMSMAAYQQRLLDLPEPFGGGFIGSRVGAVYI